MRKRIFYSILSILCLASLVVTGCGKKGTNTDSSSASVSSSSASSGSASSGASSSSVTPTATAEGAVPSDLPDLEDATEAKLGEACQFTKDGQASYQVTILSAEVTDRPASTDTQKADQVVLVTYTYQSLTQEAVLVDEMSFRCITGDQTVCSPYYLADQTMPELAENGQTVTAELAYGLPADTSQISLYLENPGDSNGEKFLIRADLS